MTAVIPLTAACVVYAAQAFGLVPEVLEIIHTVEGGKVGEVVRNSNGTVDMGPMQINSTHLPMIARKTGLPADVVRFEVTNNGCYNVFMAAYILRRELEGANGDLWRAIGNYHSRTDEHHRAYRQRVLHTAIRKYGMTIFYDPNSKIVDGGIAQQTLPSVDARGVSSSHK